MGFPETDVVAALLKKVFQAFDTLRVPGALWVGRWDADAAQDRGRLVAIFHAKTAILVPWLLALMHREETNLLAVLGIIHAISPGYKALFHQLLMGEDPGYAIERFLVGHDAENRQR